MNQVLLMAHVLFGMICLLAALWIFVEALNVSDANQIRIRRLSCAATAAMWLAFLIGGWWYVVLYPADKKIILKGPWPFAHSLFMETKEHLVIILLMLATYLPIVAFQNLAANRGARQIVLWVSALVAILAFAMDGEGAIISMGVKMALLLNQK